MEMVMMTQMGAVNFIAPSQCKLGGASGLPPAKIGFRVRLDVRTAGFKRSSSKVTSIQASIAFPNLQADEFRHPLDRQVTTYLIHCNGSTLSLVLLACMC
jgi:hypothetical protein